MVNIDKELIDWAVHTIKTQYPEDVALLIGRKGACKLPTDEQNIAFDFFVPCTQRGYNLSQTFVIEEMGYDLFPMSWERLEGIVNLDERITFAFANGVVIYARTKEEEERFLNLQKQLRKNLNDSGFRYSKALELVDVAMNIFKTMSFDTDLSHIRKAAGGIMEYLMMAIATVNGTYLGADYGLEHRIEEIKTLTRKPNNFEEIYEGIIKSKKDCEIKGLVYDLIENTREFFFEIRGTKVAEEGNYNYEDLASWYYEARYTFRKVEYYCKVKDYMISYELGCYLQIEFDAIQEEFGLDRMDLLGVFEWDNLNSFEARAKELENYVLEVLDREEVKLKIYSNLQGFLEANLKK